MWDATMNQDEAADELHVIGRLDRLTSFIAAAGVRSVLQALPCRPTGPLREVSAPAASG